MKEDAEVFAIDAEKIANFVFVLFFQEDSAQELAIPRGELLQYAANFVLFLLRDDRVFDVENLIRFFEMVGLKGLGARAGAIELEQDIVTDRVDEGTEAFGLADGVLAAECGDHPGESFLAQFLDGVRRQKAGAELDFQKLLKIGDKVLLDWTIAIAQLV